MSTEPKKGAEFFGSKILIHTHVEKAAGSTLVAGLTASFGAEHVRDLRGPSRVHPRDLTAAQKRATWLLTGHFHYGRMGKYFARDKIYVASVRAPFDRFRSYVNYIREGHPAYKDVVGRTFSEIVREFIENDQPAAHNPMARMLTNQSNPSEAFLFETIEDNYLLISPNARINEALRAIISFVGTQPIMEELHENRGQRKPRDDSNDDLQALEALFNEVNQLDRKLFEYAQSGFDDSLSRLPEQLEKIVKRQPGRRI